MYATIPPPQFSLYWMLTLFIPMVVVLIGHHIDISIWREGITIYEHTSYPSNIKLGPPIGMLPIHLKMALSRLIRDL